MSRFYPSNKMKNDVMAREKFQQQQQKKKH